MIRFEVNGNLERALRAWKDASAPIVKLTRMRTSFIGAGCSSAPQGPDGCQAPASVTWPGSA